MRTTIFILSLLSIVIVISCSESKNESVKNETEIEINEVDNKSMGQYDTLVRVAIGLSEKGEYIDALDYIDKAIKMYPEEARAYMEKGVIYSYMGEYNKAEKALLKSIEIEPTDLAYINLGYECFLKRDFKKALDYTNKAIEIDPDNEQALTNRVVIQMNSGDLEDGLKNVNQLLEKYPENGNYMYNKAYILHLMGKDDEACPLFEKSLENGCKEAQKALDEICK